MSDSASNIHLHQIRFRAIFKQHYAKITATGYNSGNVTFKSEYYMLVHQGASSHASSNKWNIIQNF